jgi:predicted secreted hydrolase
LLSKEPSIPWTHLELNFDNQIFKKLADQTYQLKLHHKRSGLDVDLNIQPLIKPVRHGHDGIIRNSAVEDMFYYFIPKCKASGKIRIKKELFKIPQGTAWYDHEFGARPASKKSITKKNIAWNWLGIQLDNGFQFTVFDVHTRKKIKDKNTLLIGVDPKGNKYKTLDYTFDSYGDRWTSTRTFNDYPTRWKLISSAFKLELDIQASFEGQEFGTVISKPAFWEGRLNITGKHRGRKDYR